MRAGKVLVQFQQFVQLIRCFVELLHVDVDLCHIFSDDQRKRVKFLCPFYFRQASSNRP